MEYASLERLGLGLGERDTCGLGERLGSWLLGMRRWLSLRPYAESFDDERLEFGDSIKQIIKILFDASVSSH